MIKILIWENKWNEMLLIIIGNMGVEVSLGQRIMSLILDILDFKSL